MMEGKYFSFDENKQPDHWQKTGLNNDQAVRTVLVYMSSVI